MARTYCVEWSIDIDADSPEEAARLARDKQQWPREGYWCGVFQVTPHDSAETETIDLDEIDEQNATAATHGA